MTKWLAVMAICAALLIGCTEDPNTDSPTAWEIVESPATGKCYEVLKSRVSHQYVVWSLGSEVPC